jgi:hypothetical protein
MSREPRNDAMGWMEVQKKSCRETLKHSGNTKQGTRQEIINRENYRKVT